MGKWTCTIIQNTETGKYRVADFRIDGKDIYECTEITESYYRPLADEVKRITGIHLLKRKDMIFERLSDFEKIATIDVTQYRGEGKDCRVTLEERKNGWKPCFEEIVDNEEECESNSSDEKCEDCGSFYYGTRNPKTGWCFTCEIEVDCDGHCCEFHRL